MNAIQWLLDIPHRFGEREFLRDAQTGESVSFADLHRSALAIAADLRRRGLRQGDRVILMLHNSTAFARLYFGCLYAGLVATPINPILAKREVQQIADHVDAKLFVVSPSTVGGVDAAAAAHATYQMLILQDGSTSTSSTDGPSLTDFWEIWRLEDLPEVNDFVPFEGVTADDAMCLVFTSGTTGMPSGVEHRIASLVGNACLFNRRLGITEENRFYGILAMTYLGGYYNLLLLPYCAGASVVLNRTFDARAALDFWRPAIEHGVNTLWLVPTILAILLEMDRGSDGEKYCREHVRLALIGTAPLSTRLRQDFEQRYGVTLFENYGLSETFFISTNSPSTPVLDRCVGRILPGVEVAIVDAEGKALPYGQEGEIRVCSPYLMNGYYDLESRRIHAVAEGDWFATGDIGIQSANGDLSITGRKKNLIIRGGINVSPRQIENVLQSHPAVLECAVVGIPHFVYGEDIAAAVRLEKGTSLAEIKSELLTLCRSQLGAIKQPAQIVELEEFPYSSSGKIQHRKVREILTSKLGSTAGSVAPTTPVEQGPLMIPGRIRQARPHVGATELERLRKFPTSIVSDVLNRLGIMDAAIHSLIRGRKMVGRALTVEEVEGGNLMSHAALELVRPGDVLVIDAKGVTSRACWGGLQTLQAQQRGAVGIVLNGATRDFEAIEQSAIPMFARGISPGGPLKGWSGNVNVPIACGGVVVNPGDVVLGDDDGVVVVPYELVDMVLDCCGRRAALETKWFERVERGETTMDVVGLRAKIQELGVQLEGGRDRGAGRASGRAVA
ncbi:MAG: AMP-binding protein [Pirellulaceae bacterium]